MTLRFPSVLPFVLLAAACSVETAPPSPEAAVVRSRAAIVAGYADTAHPAVVSLTLGEGSFDGSCTGTIVKIDPARRIGWVATAAHCIETGVWRVIETEDTASGTGVVYGVLDYEADPRYRGQDDDYAMVRILGVDATTPTIPLVTSPDGLAVGSKVTSVGFGRTLEATTNTKRMAIDMTIAELTSDLVGYVQRTGGICNGDSGGPVLSGSGPAERVVAIHSYGVEGCQDRAYSARVTDGLAFFGAQLAKPLPALSCDLCRRIETSGKGACAAITTACLADDDCRGYQDCIAARKKDAATCASEFTLAAGPSLAAKSCACGGPCAEACANDASCAGVGKCGAEVRAEAECSACIESACCAEHSDCTGDGRCHLCLEKDDTFPSCTKNEPRKRLAACAKDKCAAPCAGSTLPTIGVEEAPAPEEAAPPEEEAGCRVARARGPASPAALVALSALAVALVRRRRRRGSARGVERGVHEGE